MSAIKSERLNRAFAEIQQTARATVNESGDVAHNREYDNQDRALEVWNKEEEVKVLAYEFERNGNHTVPSDFADFLIDNVNQEIKISGEISDAEIVGKDGRIIYEFSVGGIITGRKHGIRNTNFIALVRRTVKVRDIIFVDETGRHLKILESSEAFSPVIKATTEELNNAKLTLGFIQSKLEAAIALSPQSQL